MEQQKYRHQSSVGFNSWIPTQHEGSDYINLGAGLPANQIPAQVTAAYPASVNGGSAYNHEYTYPHPLVSGASPTPTPTPRQRRLQRPRQRRHHATRNQRPQLTPLPPTSRRLPRLRLFLRVLRLPQLPLRHPHRARRQRLRLLQRLLR